MPRPERPLDPAAGPIAQFAVALRALRAAAGNPTYRRMAERVPVSPSALAAAADGRRLPTWEVTREYVRACGGREDEWRERWHAVREATPGAARSVAEPAKRHRRRRGWRAGLAAGALAAAAVVAVAAWTMDHDPPATVRDNVAQPTARFSLPSHEPVRDDADPKRSGCADNPATIQELDRIQVNTAKENLLGVAAVRHSPGCHASWGRFEPSERLTYLRGPVRVTITARRPATGTVGEAYATDFDGQAVFGNILLDTTGCVEITVRVEAPDGGGSATTHCVRQ
nr:helix-turn-helix domain-containing protein [uncultured Actinoplanes sp.]